MRAFEALDDGARHRMEVWTSMLEPEVGTTVCNKAAGNLRLDKNSPPSLCPVSETPSLSHSPLLRFEAHSSSSLAFNRAMVSKCEAGL